ncbi:YwbE family protein [Ancylomarina sp.]|uniref:YwbE family protein n=1 Tax=Ancylomarina sp. TaxID=1970196 RepID=UPI0035690ABD
MPKQTEIAFDLKISRKNMMENDQPDGRKRKDIKVGLEVEIVQKQDQRSGNLTEGVIKRILTKSPNHPHGIKVQLETGEVGRVKNILDEEF